MKFEWRGTRRHFYPSEVWTHTRDPDCPNSDTEIRLVDALGCGWCGRHPPEVRLVPAPTTMR
jgi:hypothetical protein